MRNQIGFPPIDREVDTGSSLPAGSTAPKVPHHRQQEEISPDVAEGARHADTPYVGGFDRPVTERDTNVSLYVGLTIGAIALIILLMVFSAFF
ncbi:MAG TPA: hypothetical protein VGR35_16550 [Tepidisphaeraceae bacterium]|nr:hypothetical protein [Tepidisphaeraceae bacterium]